MSCYILKIRDYDDRIILQRDAVYGSIPRVGETLSIEFPSLECAVGPGEKEPMSGITAVLVVDVSHLIRLQSWFDGSTRSQSTTVIRCDLLRVVAMYGVRNLGVRLPR